MARRLHWRSLSGQQTPPRFAFRPTCQPALKHRSKSCELMAAWSPKTRCNWPLGRRLPRLTNHRIAQSAIRLNQTACPASRDRRFSCAPINWSRGTNVSLLFAFQRHRLGAKCKMKFIRLGLNQRFLRKGFEVHGASRTGRRLVGLRRSFSKIRNLNFDLMRPYRWSLLSCYLKSTFHNGSSGGGATRSGNRSKSDQAIFNWRAVIRYRSTDANTCQPVVVTGSNWNQENDPTQTAHSARNTMSEKRSALGHFNCLGAVARGDCDHH